MSGVEPHGPGTLPNAFSGGEFVAVENPVSHNIASEVLMVTCDKVELALYHHRDRLRARDSWIAPLGVVIAGVLALTASTFRAKFGLSADAWQAVFVLGTALAGVWLIVSLVRLARGGKQNPTEAILSELRNAE